jgi:hypothetical protein
LSWTLATGRDGADKIIVLIDESFRDAARRGGRDTRVSVRFLGSHMLKSVENRDNFDDRLTSTLASNDGVVVAGVTRTAPVSYTFIAYCQGDIKPSEIPIEDALRASCTVSVYHDPEWKEYEAWLPEPSKGFGRIALILRSLLFRLVGPG